MHVKRLTGRDKLTTWGIFDMAVRLVVRDRPTSPWIKNFEQLGWKIRKEDNSGWIQMHPGNTKLRSTDNTKWLNVK